MVRLHIYDNSLSILLRSSNTSPRVSHSVIMTPNRLCSSNISFFISDIVFELRYMFSSCPSSSFSLFNNSLLLTRPGCALHLLDL